MKKKRKKCLGTKVWGNLKKVLIAHKKETKNFFLKKTVSAKEKFFF